MRNNSELPIAIIGAGFSGTSVALQLFARNIPRDILLFGQDGNFGRGLAYSTDCPHHWLNVPADGLSLYADQPDHFIKWLEGAPKPPGTTAEGFATRSLYGRYLEEEIRTAAAAPGSRLRLVAGQVTDIIPNESGLTVTTASGQTHAVGHVVLALGHPRPSQGGGALYITDPWRPGSLDEMIPDLPVMIVGTGLTMIDVALKLRADGLRAPIFAISRRGLLPREHGGTSAATRATVPDRRSLLRMIRRARKDIARATERHASWHDVIDGLRPITQELWAGLSLTDKSRFLRHLRPWWDVHRHRIAPPAARAINQLIAEGALNIAPGRIVGISAGPLLTVTWRHRGETTDRTITVQKLINATGVDREAESHDPLRMQLERRGLATAGPLGLGIQVNKDLSVAGASTGKQVRMWALGPITRGVFWECTAVPDIRAQASRLAETLAV